MVARQRTDAKPCLVTTYLFTDDGHKQQQEHRISRINDVGKRFIKTHVDNQDCHDNDNRPGNEQDLPSGVDGEIEDRKVAFRVVGNRVNIKPSQKHDRDDKALP